MMKKTGFTILMVGFFWLGTAGSLALAGLDWVSGQQDNGLTAVAADGEPTQVAVSLANGFPLWYQDSTGLKLAQCLETEVEIGGVGIVNPCELGLLNPQFPPSLVNLSEVNYWQADTGFNYNSRLNGEIIDGGFALLLMALKGGAAGEAALFDGNQAVSSRIRLRIDLPVNGTYRVTHPFGTFDYVIDDQGTGRRAINQTQDVGNLAVDAQNFLIAMRDRGDDFIVPVAFDPAEDDLGAVVNEDGATIGPFLVPASEFNDLLQGGPVTDINGNRYIGLPFAPGLAPLVPIFQPITGSVPVGDDEPANFFRIELLDPPDNFFLNAVNNTQVLESLEFLVIGKIFNDGANEVPKAPEEVTVGVLKGRSTVDIDVFAGLDAAGLVALDPVVEGLNVHGIDPQAIALADPVTGVFRDPETNMPLLSQTEQLASGAAVRRITRLVTGQSLFNYTLPLNPPAGFSDSFHYVVQDTGGLISAPALVNVLVEDLQVNRADFRVKTGQWQVSGTTDSPTESVTLLAGPQARLSGDNLPIPVATGMAGRLGLFLEDDFIDYHLVVNGITPQDNITEVSIRFDGGGQPIMFRLCGNPFIFPFPPACSVSGGVLEVESFLMGFDLLAAAASVGVTSFSAAVDAVARGNTYVNLATSANPAGQVRGPIVAPMLGSAPVMGGAWEFRGKNRFPSGLLPNVMARSDIGVQTLSVPLRLR